MHRPKKDLGIAYILWIFGCLWIHRFYLETKIKSALILIGLQILLAIITFVLEESGGSEFLGLILGISLAVFLIPWIRDGIRMKQMVQEINKKIESE